MPTRVLACFTTLNKIGYVWAVRYEWLFGSQIKIYQIRSSDKALLALLTIIVPC